MKLLDRLVIKELVAMLFVGIALFSALWFAGGTLVTAARYLAEGVPASIVLRVVLLSIPPILGLTFPMGMLLAVLVGFGRLSADSETVALFAGGIPFLRIALPAAVLGLAVSVVGYIINDPIASYDQRQINLLKDQLPQMQGQSSQPIDLQPIRSHGVLQATVHVEGGFDLTAGVMRQVTITTFSPDGHPATAIYAPRARYQGGNEWQLQDVDVNVLGANPVYNHWTTLQSRDIKVRALNVSADSVALLAADPSTYTFPQLRRLLREVQAGGQADSPDARYDEVTLWSKISFPLASFIFALVGSPLALRPQRTSRMTGWVLSVPMILIYWVSFLILSSMARGGVISPFLAAFLPDIVGVALGVYLIWRRST